jgi:putative FmdB family regulatory protein
MPTYEFACRSCGREFEVEVARIGGRPEGCPACGAQELDRLLSPFAAHTSAAGPSPSAAAACPMAEACGGGCACRGDLD